MTLVREGKNCVMDDMRHTGDIISDDTPSQYIFTCYARFSWPPSPVEGRKKRGKKLGPLGTNEMNHVTTITPAQMQCIVQAGVRDGQHVRAIK